MSSCSSSPLRTLAYVSVAARELTDSELLQLVYGAQRFNYSVSVTGLLIFDHEGFLQTIEGSPTAVDEVFARIRKDTLHKDITVFVDESIEKRLYPDWAMLNSMEHASGPLRSMVQYAMDSSAAQLTAGQIEAARLTLDRISRRHAAI